VTPVAGATLERLSVLDLPWPTDWSAVFGAPARPVVLEIGFGRGDFLLHLARSRPDAFVVGIEVSNRSLAAAEKRLMRGEAPNARVIHASAEAALAHLFGPASLAEIHVNFPDPWFKTRHEGRRLVRPAVLAAMVSRLEPGGRLRLATDVAAYAEMAADLLAQTPGLANELEAPWASEMPGRVVTKYEARARAEGRACHYFAYRRTDAPAPPVATPQELPMPHVVLEGPIDLGAVRAGFAPATLADGDAHVGLIEAYLADGALLLEAHVEEPTIAQRVGLVLRRRSPERHVLGLGAIGRPRATPGIHRAVALVARWLLERCPGARVAQDGLVVDRGGRRVLEALGKEDPAGG